MPVHLGLGLLTGQVPPGSAHSVADEYEGILRLARAAEEAGFAAAWVSEHHFAEDSHLPSLLPMLAAVAAVTERIRLGTAVVLAPFHHPLRFAEDCAVVDQLSRGRLIVGLGAGWRKREFELFGIPFAERASRTAELVRICRAAWEEERFTFAGKHHTFTDVSVTPKPVGTIPIFLGGSVPAAIARAGRLGGGFIATPADRIDVFREEVAQFDAAARAAGRDPRGLAIGFHVNAWVSPDGRLPEEVRAAMWQQIGRYAVWHAQDEGHGVTAFPPIDDERIRARTWLGTAAQVLAKARPWTDEFGDRELHVIVRLHYPGMSFDLAEGAIRAFAADVAPGLMSRNAAAR